ncbi:MAG TPA: hypothetical protein VLZ06_03745 [Solirubrobacteraceae bacterium]|nr:hypothetical protein [Solirubrobacteraceae bacterium]
MAVGVVIQFSGGTTAQYDQVIEKMGFKPSGAGAPGLMFHWITETPDGLRVTDVWESREQFDKFAQEQIGPFTQEVGIPGPPDITYHEVYNYLTAG